MCSMPVSTFKPSVVLKLRKIKVYIWSSTSVYNNCNIQCYGHIHNRQSKVLYTH